MTRLIDMTSFTTEKLVQALTEANVAYRAGNPIITDYLYDTWLFILADRHPEHPYLHAVEPEAIFGKTVKLPERMLSTNKAYSLAEIDAWACSVMKIGNDLGVGDAVLFRITPKLDGFAAYDTGANAFTRGDGYSGTDISHAFARGLNSHNRSGGKGEIVVDKRFFADELADDYENSRNVIASVIKVGPIDPKIQMGINLGKICFAPFSELNGWTLNKDNLLCNLEEIWDLNLSSCPFNTDGLVIEAVDERIKGAMGSTDRHHRWQIAYKKNEEYHDIKVTGLVWQTSKNGRLTPVVQLEPTKVSGVTISRATGHNWGNVFTHGIDSGAVVRVCRSGLVIPYIESVINPCNEHRNIKTPEQCPSCNSPTEIDGDNLMCSNTGTCPAQIEGRIEFFFKTLGNCDGFGPKVIEQIHTYMTKHEAPKTISMVYALSLADFEDIVGGKTAMNLESELYMSRQRHIEDWRFLAAFSIHNVGKGGCERLLKHHRLAGVFDLSIEAIVKIDGFAEKSANSLVNSLINIKPEFDALMKMGFNLTQTALASEKSVTSAIAGKTIVFTGSMQKGGRADMEKQAKSLGASVGSSVSSKTNYLVCGSNVGASKTDSAKKNGTTVISEDDYLKLLVVA